MISNSLYREKKDSYFQLSREEMLPFVNNNAATIIEFGCGNGAFGSVVKRNINCFYEGIEPISDFAELAKKNIDKISCTNVEDFIMEYRNSLNKDKYDVIVFNDILEHLLNPYEVIENVKEMLNNEGTLVASIPNFLNYNSLIEIFSTKDFKYKDGGILDKTHLRFFTKKSIIRMFEDAGYKIVQIKGIHQTVNSMKFKILNFLSLGYINEFKFLQFAVVVKPN
jgi:2-polyprenyl-3-methyl-5-hydroxy-6-metoxy-1,4-benzoquinol methylase